MRNTYFKSLWLILCLLGPMACNDENGIYFTQDEIVEGDINTGKQIGLKENTLVVYTHGGGSVNVQGAKGEIRATSSDEQIATVRTAQEGKNSAIVTAVAIGKTLVTVTDAEGASATFSVVVKDEDELWTSKRTYSIGKAKQCIVEGASPADSAAIAADALALTTESLCVFKTRTFLPGGTAQRLSFYNEAKELLYEGLIAPLESIEEGRGRFSLYAHADEQELLASFIIDTKTSTRFLIKDLTETYKAQSRYSTVSKVWVYLPLTALL